MLTNKNILEYKERNKCESEIEKDILYQDEDYFLNLERPLEISQIKKIKRNRIHNFIDDIMCNKSVNKLLYSNNAKKELTFYLKQKKSLLKIIPLKKMVVTKTFSQKLKHEKMMNDIQNYIDKYKMSRNKESRIYKEKNEKFINSQYNIEKRLSLLDIKPINEIRYKGYEKALNKCLNLSKKEKNFNLPDVELNKNNVYSRLYNNYIMSNKIKKIKSVSELMNKNNNTFNKINNKDKKEVKIRKIRKRKIENENNDKKRIKFIINSSLSEKNNNKQFVMEVNKRMIRKSWEEKSGGPNSLSFSKKKGRKRFKEKINYKILSRNCLKGEKKDISLFNTMIVNNPNLDNYFIQNKNYRDIENNSNLHIAVKNNSIKMVEYFINKNNDINHKNKDGYTPLHLACKLGNEAIIKLLVNKGADINAQDNKGRIPYDFL